MRRRQIAQGQVGLSPRITRDLPTPLGNVQGKSDTHNRKARNRALPCGTSKVKAQKEKAAPKSPLKYEVAGIEPDEFLNAGRERTGEATRQKRQEYSRRMAHATEYLEHLAEKPSQAEIARYISTLAEDERRWLGRRSARASAIGHSREVLLVRMFEAAAARVKWTINPRGCATKFHAPSAGRIVNSLCTDWHVGWKNPKEEGPEPYDLKSSSRSVAQLSVQLCDYKPQYRSSTRANLLFGGDGFEGFLQHGPERDNYTLTEQMVAYGSYKAAYIARAAECFEQVDVFDVPGNHGRNKLVHPGRATSSKWDSFETVVAKFVEQQCKPLQNVRFHIGKAPAIVVPLFDKRMLFTHGDTELRLGSPSAKASTWEAALNAVNGDLRYGCRIDLLAAGHFHDPRVMHFTNSDAICNGALVPANGYSRALGYNSVTGQFIWESVPGYAVGDVRFVRVDPQAKGRELDKVIPPYIF